MTIYLSGIKKKSFFFVVQSTRVRGYFITPSPKKLYAFLLKQFSIIQENTLFFRGKKIKNDSY